jgi:hypothetical protein
MVELLITLPVVMVVLAVEAGKMEMPVDNMVILYQKQHLVGLQHTEIVAEQVRAVRLEPVVAEELELLVLMVALAAVTVVMDCKMILELVQMFIMLAAVAVLIMLLLLVVVVLVVQEAVVLAQTG